LNADDVPLQNLLKELRVRYYGKMLIRGGKILRILIEKYGEDLRNIAP